MECHQIRNTHIQFLSLTVTYITLEQHNPVSTEWCPAFFSQLHILHTHLYHSFTVIYIWIYKHVSFVLIWLEKGSVENDNTVVIYNFHFEYVKLVNNAHRMSCKVKWFKILWWHFKHRLLELYVNDTTLTHSTNGLNILELHHRHTRFNLILTGSNYAILHFWLLTFCGLCPSSSIWSRTHFGNCICFHP
jgi:hypothetical protein